MHRGFFVFIFLFSLTTKASQITEGFTSTVLADVPSSTAVWNIALGVIHPSLFVNRWNAGGTDQFTSFDVGDGRDGAFIPSRYALFSENGDISGNTIRLSTDRFHQLRVTEFQLDNTWTIEAQGAFPLIIKSLTTIKIDGTINCNGGNGSPQNLDDTIKSAGGTGRCGGGKGGDGAIVGTASEVGASPDPALTDAVGGINAANAGALGEGGGGGGAFSQDISNNSPASGPRAAGGTSSQDDGFLTVAGGTGGAGGGTYSFAPNRSNGAGGGAGGGIVVLWAVKEVAVSATGNISVDGGNGGSGTIGGGKGGGGGAGGGGGVWILAGTTADVTGPVTAHKGIGGTSDGGDGGDGAEGRTWITDSDGALGDCFPSGNGDSPQTVLAKLGCVEYSTIPEVAISASFDLLNSKPKNLVSGLVADLQGGTAELDWAGSSDNFTSSNSGWFPSTNLIPASGYRYVKYRLRLTNVGVLTPTTVDSVSLTYEGEKKSEYKFIAAGCGVLGKSFWDGLFIIGLLGLVRLLFKMGGRAGCSVTNSPVR